MALTMRGSSAVVKYGYQVAARIGAWSFEHDRMDGKAIEINSVWIAETPLSLWLTIGERAWVWRDVSVVNLDPAQFAVRVSGSPEVR